MFYSLSTNYCDLFAIFSYNLNVRITADPVDSEKTLVVKELLVFNYFCQHPVVFDTRAAWEQHLSTTLYVLCNSTQLEHFEFNGPQLHTSLKINIGFLSHIAELTPTATAGIRQRGTRYRACNKFVAMIDVDQ